ncbi:MAG TPA: apolipoprotein N-acyltransferase [Actinobacteria bacterium]|nr:apolipoprotein N-acyltransferase [Actinomycetota bacterium]
MINYLAVVLGGLLLWAAFPPLDLGALAFVAPTPVFWALRRIERPGEALTVGFLWGWLFFGPLLWWISVLGFVAWVPLVMLMSAMYAAYAIVVWSARLWPAWRWWLVAIGAWVVMEFVRARFPFGGFPWGSLGYAAGGFQPFLGAVQWIGPVGWSVLAIAVSAGLALVVEDRRHWRFVVDPAVVVLLLALGGSFLAPKAEGRALRVAIVQGSSPCPMVHCQNENERIYRSHLELTRSIPEGGADLVVWAENSFGTPFDPGTDDTVRNEIVAEAERIGAYVLVSGTRLVEDDGFLNVNMLYSPEGVLIGEYAKRHPVPFGEYVPLRGILGFIPQLDQVPRDMVRGADAVVFPLEEGRLGSVISFEGAFARWVRSVAVAGAETMIVATNESSFGVSPASDQLIGMTRVNAAAIGQDLVHAAITGKSTFIDADGSVGETTGLFERTVLYGVVQMRTDPPTLYTRYGDWVGFLAVAGLVAAMFWPGEGSLESRWVAARRG